jgi:RHS repeat-associated protein
LGSVRQIANANGYIILTKDYEPYGSLLNSSGSGNSIYGFTGEERDTTGLIFLRVRYMQPGLGIFLARDPWSGDVLQPGSMNGFDYVEGNPINLSDPTGSQSPGSGTEDFLYCLDLHTLEPLGFGPKLHTIIRDFALGDLTTAQQAVDVCRAAYSKAYWEYVPARGFDFASGLPPTAHDLFGWFLYDFRGNHRTDRLYFDASQPLTQELAKTSEMDQVRASYYDGQLKEPGIREYQFGIPQQVQSLLDFGKNPGAVSLPISMFMGSFWYQVVPLDNGNRVGFRIDNDTTLSSGTHVALRHQTPTSLFVEDLVNDNRSLANKPIRQLIAEYPSVISILHNRTRAETGGQGGGNLYQTYRWSEEYDCDAILHLYLGFWFWPHDIQVWDGEGTIDPPGWPAQ